MENLKQLIELETRIASSQRANFGTGTPIQFILDAENYLGMMFPPTYRWWLQRYGTGYLGGYELQGLFPELITDRDPEIPLIGDILELAKINHAAKRYPSHLLEILNYDGDEVYLFDTQRRSTTGEWPVVCIDANFSTIEDVADNFGHFLRMHL